MSITPLRSVYQIKITLKGIRPPIWRRLLVENSINLEELHIAIQIAMGWTNSHLHQFVLNGECFGVPDEDFPDHTREERDYRVGNLLKQEKDRMIYEYDFGDGWEHIVELESISVFDMSLQLPVCIKGKRNCPPEDVGGVPGYNHLIDVLGDESDPEYQDMIDWLGGKYDPEAFELVEVNNLLKKYCVEEMLVD